MTGSVEVYRRRRADTDALCAGLGSALVAAALTDPDRLEQLPILCPFRRATGLPCPGCGLSRSWALTAHLRLGDAFRAHLFGPPTFVLAAFLLGSGPGSRSVARTLEGRFGFVGGGAIIWLVWAGHRMLRHSRSD